MRWLVVLGGLFVFALGLFFWLGARAGGPGLVPAATSATEVAAAEEVVAPRSRETNDGIATPEEGTTNRSPVVDEALASGRRVRGSVVVPAGGSLDDIRVALVLLDGMAAPERTVATARPGPDGTFELSADEAGEHRVVAFTSNEALKEFRKALRPTSAEIVIDAQDVTLPTPLEMSDRESISGRVVLANGPFPFAFTVSAHPNTVRIGEQVGPLMWTGTSFEYDNLHVVTPAGLEFELTGLGPLEYQCSFGFELDADVAIGRIPRFPKQHTFVAPAVGKHVNIGLALLLCRVRTAGQSLPDATVTVKYGEDSSGVRTKASGCVAFEIPAGQDRVQLVFEKQGYSRHAMEVDPRAHASDRWIEVELDELPVASLHLILSVSEVREVTVTQRPVGPHAPEGFVGTGFVADGFVPARADSFPVVEGVVTVAPMVPGKYTVRVAASAWMVPQEFEIELAAGQKLHRNVELAWGGRLEVPPLEKWAKAIEPEQPIRYRLLDGRGVPVKTFPEELRWRFTTELAPVLPVGPYTLEIFQHEGTAPLYGLPVTIEAKQVTRLAVQ